MGGNPGIPKSRARRCRGDVTRYVRHYLRNRQRISGQHPASCATARHSNAEWYFMGRTFFVWSLAEMSLRDPQAKAAYQNGFLRIEVPQSPRSTKSILVPISVEK